MTSAIHRRAAILGAPALTLLAAAGARAGEVPRQGAMPPLFYRLKLGAFEVTALLDGSMLIPNARIQGFFPDSTPEEIAPLRERAFSIEGGLAQPSAAYVVNTGRNLAMIDCGGHPSVMPGTGGALAALRAAGYAPEQVDTVILTHVHPEHAMGLSYDGTTRNFPNAEIVLTEVDHRFWTDPAMEGQVPQGPPFIQAARRALRPYEGRIRKVEMRDGLEVIPGIVMVPAPGHTPGHVSYRLASGGQSMLIWGDIAHQTVIQFARPRWRVGVDVDAAQAVENRVRTLTMAAEERLLVGGCHVPWPGFGRVVREGEGFLYVPRPLQLA